jgi:hypothetical protein
MSALSIYDSNAPRLIELGYHVLPIIPETKIPGCYVPSLGTYQKMLDWTHPRRRIVTSSQPGAGISVRLGEQPDGTFVVALDWDRDDIAVAALDAFPYSAIKEGKRGLSGFYRSTKRVPTRAFKINGAMAVQVLSEGTQTVLPPTVHPETQRPYFWSSKSSLYDNKPGDLPELPDDYVARIENILAAFGYVREESNRGFVFDNVAKEPKTDSDNSREDDPFWELNKLAMRDLAAWVPALNLYNCRRRRGGGASYEAVATWRPSSTGRPIEERKRNLVIGPKGIIDFGTNETFSPINLVTRAQGCARPEAIGWLQERVCVKGPDIDFDAILTNGPGIVPEPEQEQEQDACAASRDAQEPAQKYRFKLISFDDMRPGADQPYVIDELIPAKGIVVVWGPPKCLKSFMVLDMMLHVAKGWEYHDRAVQQGAVVYCAFEGGHGYKKRIEALRRHYELEPNDQVPIFVMPGQTNLVSDHRLLVKEIKAQLGDVAPIVVVLDTLNKSLPGSESKDIDMANYQRAAESIRDAFKCVVIIVHHCGWDESRMRGHSSLKGGLDAELSISREGDVVTVTVEAMRDGPEDTQVVGKARIVEVGQDANGRALTSLVIERHEPEGPVGGKGRKWPKRLKVFHDALIEATLSAGIDHQIENGAKVKAVDLEKVRAEFYKTYVVTGGEATHAEQRQDSKLKAFSRAVKDARVTNLISARALDDGSQLIWLVAPFEQSRAI